MTVSLPGAVPFFPPALFEADRAALIGLVREVGLDPEQRFILGRRTAAFEDLLREDLEAADVVACSSGTSALTLVLRALDVGPGDEVIVPAFGCAPLAASVAGTGATPVFADIRPDTMTMDPAHAERLVTARTKAVMPAHMFSVMADMPSFVELARRHGLRLVEDSAVAQGGVLRGVPAGLWGEAGVYSFVQVKTCGMPGEGAWWSPGTRSWARRCGCCATTARSPGSASCTTPSGSTAASTRSRPRSRRTATRASLSGWRGGRRSPPTTPSASRRWPAAAWSAPARPGRPVLLRLHGARLRPGRPRLPPGRAGGGHARLLPASPARAPRLRRLRATRCRMAPGGTGRPPSSGAAGTPLAERRAGRTRRRPGVRVRHRAVLTYDSTYESTYDCRRGPPTRAARVTPTPTQRNPRGHP